MRCNQVICGITASIILSISPLTAVATPNAFNIEYETQATQRNTNTNVRVDENVTGLESRVDKDGNTTLKADIETAMPLIEEAFKTVYNSIETELKKKIKEDNLDYEYTMQSFSDADNPYRDIDMTRFVAAYATVIKHGRNGKPILYDVPLIKMTVDYQNIDDNCKYAEITLKAMTPEDLLAYYGYTDEAILNEYEERYKAIDTALNGLDLQTTIFTESPESVQENTGSKNLANYNIPEDISEERKRIVDTALSLVGKVPYLWGGKSSKPGIDETWWQYLSNGKQNGLDCSGFVRWVFQTTGYDNDITNKLWSTYQMRSDLEDISRDELQPGDIGLLKDNDVGTNHCGIYIGNGLWVHCSSSAKTVTVNSFGFRFFKRMPGGDVDTTIYDDYQDELANGSSVYRGAISYTEEEIRTFAQLIEHEVGGESYNSWVAVAEVTVNRVKSKSFPNTLNEVIYQPHQYSYVSEIVQIEPRQSVIDVARSVANGTLRYWDNEHVLFFKNPTITNGIPSSTPYDWGKYKYYGYVDSTAFYLEEGSSTGYYIPSQQIAYSGTNTEESTSTEETIEDTESAEATESIEETIVAGPAQDILKKIEEQSEEELDEQTEMNP